MSCDVKEYLLRVVKSPSLIADISLVYKVIFDLLNTIKIKTSVFEGICP